MCPLCGALSVAHSVTQSGALCGALIPVMLFL